MVVHRAGIKQNASNALSRHKTEAANKTNLDEGLLLLMMNEIEERPDVETEDFDQEQLANRRVCKHMDTFDEKRQPLVSRRLLEASPSDRVRHQTALTIGLPKPKLIFNIKGALVRMSSILWTSQRYLPTRRP